MYKMENNYLIKNLEQHINVMESLIGQEENITEANKKIVDCFINNGCILVMGNGGSFADAIHIEGELVGRFKLDRRPFAVKAAGTSGAVLTALSNDFSFEDAYAREVEAYLRKGDVLWGITTSGNSKNVIKAFEKGQEIGTYNLLMSGKTGGKIHEKNLANLEILVNSTETARIQEAHEFIYHTMCEQIEKRMVNYFGGDK
ncbi:MAG: SIS domain-containing protein [Candidatus Pacearchaeota archaeon]|jgi:D-sedoheptulose 7-phosphate isomerase